MGFFGSWSGSRCSASGSRCSESGSKCSGNGSRCSGSRLGRSSLLTGDVFSFSVRFFRVFFKNLKTPWVFSVLDRGAPSSTEGFDSTPRVSIQHRGPGSSAEGLDVSAKRLSGWGLGGREPTPAKLSPHTFDFFLFSIG